MSVWKFSSVLLLLAIASCAHAEGDEPAFATSTAKVEVVWVPNQRELSELRAEAYQRFGFENLADRRIQAFTLTLDDGSCRIFAVKPERPNDDRTLLLGHELLHCLGIHHGELR